MSLKGKMSKGSNFLLLAAAAAGMMLFAKAATGGDEAPAFPHVLASDVIVGTWECDGAPPPFKVIKNFEAGGTMMEIDNISTQESPTIGSWKRTDELKYFLVARQFTYDTNGNWVGTFHYTQPLTMDPSRNKMAGTFHFELIDPNGNSISSGDGQVSCARMPFQEP